MQYSKHMICFSSFKKSYYRNVKRVHSHRYDFSYLKPNKKQKKKCILQRDVKHY